jgi:deoxyadenosine kinase
MAVVQNLQDSFIGIAGMIGAGKSTLCTALAKHLDLPAYYEPVADNEYLEDFYRDTKTYAFATQIYLLNRRFQQHQEVIWRGGGGVQDRTIYEDAVFARMLVKLDLMEERDYRNYLSLFRHMSNFMCRPSLIVYLDVNAQRSMERIEMRSRGVETGITLEYLEALYFEYEEFVQNIARTIPVVRVDWDRFQDVEEMAMAVQREFNHGSFLRNVSFTEGGNSWPSS